MSAPQGRAKSRMRLELPPPPGRAGGDRGEEGIRTGAWGVHSTAAFPPPHTHDDPPAIGAKKHRLHERSGSWQGDSGGGAEEFHVEKTDRMLASTHTASMFKTTISAISMKHQLALLSRLSSSRNGSPLPSPRVDPGAGRGGVGAFRPRMVDVVDKLMEQQQQQQQQGIGESHLLPHEQVKSASGVRGSVDGADTMGTKEEPEKGREVHTQSTTSLTHARAHEAPHCTYRSVSPRLAIRTDVHALVCAQGSVGGSGGAEGASDSDKGSIKGADADMVGSGASASCISHAPAIIGPGGAASCAQAEASAGDGSPLKPHTTTTTTTTQTLPPGFTGLQLPYAGGLTIPPPAPLSPPPAPAPYSSSNVPTSRSPSAMNRRRVSLRVDSSPKELSSLSTGAQGSGGDVAAGIEGGSSGGGRGGGVCGGGAGLSSPVAACGEGLATPPPPPQLSPPSLSPPSPRPTGTTLHRSGLTSGGGAIGGIGGSGSGGGVHGPMSRQLSSSLSSSSSSLQQQRVSKHSGAAQPSPRSTAMAALGMSMHFSGSGDGSVVRVGGFAIGVEGLTDAPSRPNSTPGSPLNPSGGRRRVSVNSDDGANLVIIGKLGKGNGGTVMKALYLPTMKLVALKSVHLYNAERRHQMVQELSMLYSNLADIDFVSDSVDYDMSPRGPLRHQRSGIGSYGGFIEEEDEDDDDDLSGSSSSANSVASNMSGDVPFHDIHVPSRRRSSMSQRPSSGRSTGGHGGCGGKDDEQEEDGFGVATMRRVSFGRERRRDTSTLDPGSDVVDETFKMSRGILDSTTPMDGQKWSNPAAVDEGFSQSDVKAFPHARNESVELMRLSAALSSGMLGEQTEAGTTDAVPPATLHRPIQGLQHHTKNISSMCASVPSDVAAVNEDRRCRLPANKSHHHRATSSISDVSTEWDIDGREDPELQDAAHTHDAGHPHGRTRVCEEGAHTDPFQQHHRPASAFDSDDDVCVEEGEGEADEVSGEVRVRTRVEPLRAPAVLALRASSLDCSRGTSTPSPRNRPSPLSALPRAPIPSDAHDDDMSTSTHSCVSDTPNAHECVAPTHPCASPTLQCAPLTHECARAVTHSCASSTSTQSSRVFDTQDDTYTAPAARQVDRPPWEEEQDDGVDVCATARTDTLCPHTDVTDAGPHASTGTHTHIHTRTEPSTSSASLLRVPSSSSTPTHECACAEGKTQKQQSLSSGGVRAENVSPPPLAIISPRSGKNISFALKEQMHVFEAPEGEGRPRRPFQHSHTDSSTPASTDTHTHPQTHTDVCAHTHDAHLSLSSFGSGEAVFSPTVSSPANSTYAQEWDKFELRKGMAVKSGALKLAQGDEPTHCPFIVSFYDVFSDPQRGLVNLVVEYMDGGSLEDLVLAGGCQDEDVLANISYSTLQGLCYLHERKKIHRDIKPGNLLMNTRGMVKLADFGVSKNLNNSSDLSKTFVGTVGYMSPERLQGGKYNTKADIWSLGLSLLAVGLGTYPYQKQLQSSNYFDLVDAVCEDRSPELPDTFSEECRDFIARCLIKDPVARPSAEQLLFHPFLHKARSNPLLASGSEVGRRSTKTAEVKLAELKQICDALSFHFGRKRAKTLSPLKMPTMITTQQVHKLAETLQLEDEFALVQETLYAKLSGLVIFPDRDWQRVQSPRMDRLDSSASHDSTERVLTLDKGLPAHHQQHGKKAAGIGVPRLHIAHAQTP